MSKNKRANIARTSLDAIKQSLQKHGLWSKFEWTSYKNQTFSSLIVGWSAFHYPEGDGDNFVELIVDYIVDENEYSVYVSSKRSGGKSIYEKDVDAVVQALSRELKSVIKNATKGFVASNTNLRNQLIKLGTAHPELRENLTSVLDALSKLAAHPLDGARGHQLMPRSIASKVPKLYAQDGVKDPIVHVKLFSPYSNAVWYITEYDGTQTAFGWADLGHGMGELGYIHIPELEKANRNGLPLVERDLYFRAQPLSKLKK